MRRWGAMRFMTSVWGQQLIHLRHGEDGSRRACGQPQPGCPVDGSQAPKLTPLAFSHEPLAVRHTIKTTQRRNLRFQECPVKPSSGCSAEGQTPPRTPSIAGTSTARSPGQTSTGGGQNFNQLTSKPSTRFARNVIKFHIQVLRNNLAIN